MEKPSFESGPRIPWFDKATFDEYVNKGDEALAAYESFLDAEKRMRKTRDALPHDILDPLKKELAEINGKSLPITSGRFVKYIRNLV